MLSVGRVSVGGVGGAIVYNVAVQRQEECLEVFCLGLQYFRDKTWSLLYRVYGTISYDIKEFSGH